MPLVLEQNRLDVVHKQRSNFFNWKGQFTPEFIEYLLDCYAKPESIVADPFSGSGTVLSESIRKGLVCIGYEVNPSAYFMSKFYEYAMYTEEERMKLYNVLRAEIGLTVNNMPPNVPVYIDSPDYRTSYVNLINFSKSVAQNVDFKMIPFMVNVLFLCHCKLRRCKKSWPEIQESRGLGDNKPPLYKRAELSSELPRHNRVLWL